MRVLEASWSQALSLGFEVELAYFICSLTRTEWCVATGHSHLSGSDWWSGHFGHYMAVSLRYDICTALNIVFIVTSYLKLHDAIHMFATNVFFNQVKMLMSYNVQTADLTFVGKKKEIDNK